MTAEQLDSMIANAATFSITHGRTFEMNRGKPAALAEIECCEREIGLAMPRSLRAFLMIANGAALAIRYPYKTIVGLDYIHIFDLTEIVKYTLGRGNPVRRPLPGRRPRMICFAGYLSSDACLLDARGKGVEYPVVDAPHDDFEAWRRSAPLADSFEDWLNRIFASVMSGGALTYWIADAATLFHADASQRG